MPQGVLPNLPSAEVGKVDSHLGPVAYRHSQGARILEHLVAQSSADAHHYHFGAILPAPACGSDSIGGPSTGEANEPPEEELVFLRLLSPRPPCHDPRP